MNQTAPAMPELYQIWIRIWHKMNVMENIPHNFGVNEPLSFSEIHAIQAIGNTPENNVRIIADILGVTPSATSQVVTRLTKRGLVQKVRGVRNEKEVSLELTKEGLAAYGSHEEIHAQTYARIVERIGTLSAEERATVERIFCAFESVYEERIGELTQMSLPKIRPLQEV